MDGGTGKGEPSGGCQLAQSWQQKHACMEAEAVLDAPYEPLLNRIGSKVLPGRIIANQLAAPLLKTHASDARFLAAEAELGSFDAPLRSYQTGIATRFLTR